MNKLGARVKKMKKINYKAAAGTGIRFLLFRKAIKKTQFQMAEELGVRQPEIAAMEKGTTHLEIDHLHYLNKTYGLNINWVLSSEGAMFVKGHPAHSDLDIDYVMRPPVKCGDPRYEEYTEFFQLMQIPAVEKAIMDRLKEIKDRLGEEA